MNRKYIDIDGIKTCEGCGAGASEGGIVIHYPHCQPAQLRCDNCKQLYPTSQVTAFPTSGKTFYYCPACLQQ